jgi:hypothetical protein
MNDRELLELAAKAVGYEVAIAYQPDVPRGLYVRHEDKTFVWMPLIDDADAFRLAVRLGINVLCLRSIGATGTTAIQCEKDLHKINVGIDEGGCNGDANAAARLAICHVAAEIGRGME